MPDSTDHLQPTQEELEIATDKARVYWHNIAEKALTHHKNRTLPQHVTPKVPLYRVPAIPTTSINFNEISFGSSASKKALVATGYSTIRATGGEVCGVDELVKTTPGSLFMGIQDPVSCKWTGTAFCQWIEAGEDGHRTVPSYLGILSLAWSYILSARLTELQRHVGTRVVYTDITAAGYLPGDVEESGSGFSVDIGNVDKRTARWWAAILAPGLCWNAVVTERGNETYLAPWTVSLEDERRVNIIWRDNGCLVQDADKDTPPSSEAAIEMLAGFCQLYGLGSQASAALSAALAFPAHNHFNTAVELPLPMEIRDQKHHSEPDLTDWLAIKEELPHYIALSCNCDVVISSLCTLFWEPGVPCNLVSPWLHPILNEVPQRQEIGDIPGRYAEILTLICGIRRPELFALWTGAAITGLVPIILKFVKTGTPPRDSHGFPWTGCPQTFMNFPGSGPYFHEDSAGEDWIDRADIWRLVYLPVTVFTTRVYHSLHGRLSDEAKGRIVYSVSKHTDPVRDIISFINIGHGSYVMDQKCKTEDLIQIGPLNM